jgi:hypothetical protein
MRRTQVWITLGGCIFAMVAVAGAQSTRKPGLWEMTTKMTWQQSPMPAGVTLPQGMASPFSGTTTTTQVCITQEMIDKYGAPVPQTRNSDCQVTNVVMKSSSMTAEMICTGMMKGKGTLESSWEGSSGTKGKVHFAGSMQMGQNATPVEWTAESTAVFKGPDCGSVKPLPIRDK